MRRMLMTVVLTAAAFAAHTTAAHADTDLNAYKEAMRPFAPVIADWTAEAKSFGDAALTKPELVLARHQTRSARGVLRKTVRVARSLARAGEITRACRKRIASEVRVVRQAIPRGRQLRRCLVAGG